MVHGQVCILGLVASTLLAAAPAARVEARFLSSLRYRDSVPLESSALAVVAEEGAIGEAPNEAEESVQVHETDDVTNGQEEREETQPGDDPGLAGEGTNDKHVQSTPEEEAPESDPVENKPVTEEKKGEAKKERARLSDQLLAELLGGYFFSNLPSRPPQGILPARPFSFPIGAITQPVFPLKLSFPPFPTFYTPVVPRPAPLPSHQPGVPSNAISPQITVQDNVTDADPPATEADPPATEAQESLQTSSASLPTIPPAVWVKLIANAVSDEIYDRYVNRQASSGPNSAESSARLTALSKTDSADDSVTEPDQPSQPAVGPSEPGYPSKPLPGFKINKSMLPYIPTPFPKSPFYTFDKPPTYFNFPSRVPPPRAPSETKTMATQGARPASSDLGHALHDAQGGN